jgi:prepilin-type N-terminal cleavage/methylation domain-containing protein
MPAEPDMKQHTACRIFRGIFGFTLIEIIVVLVLVGVLAVFSTQVLMNAARGYVQARSSDEVVQKAQMALQRLTVELSYIPLSSATAGSATTLNYITNNNIIGNHNIYLNGSNLMYTENGTGYVLADGVATSGLQFNYYVNYNANATTTFSTTTNIIAISLTMQGDSWNSSLSKTFSTRVTINKIQ